MQNTVVSYSSAPFHLLADCYYVVDFFHVFVLLELALSLALSEHIVHCSIRMNSTACHFSLMTSIESILKYGT